VDEPELANRVARSTFSRTISFNKFAVDAPVIAVLTVERPKVITQIGGWIKNREFPLIDIGIAAEHFCLQATELGLGTCMLGWFDERAIKKLLAIPRKTRVGLLITVGYPSPTYEEQEGDCLDVFLQQLWSVSLRTADDGRDKSILAGGRAVRGSEMSEEK
jgi:nitroreductase